MDKPEYCWIGFFRGRMLSVYAFDPEWAGFEKFRITYNESGDVIRLDRVEE